MEAVPRLPMISFELLTTTEKVQFGPKLKPYIASFYQEDPESYSNEIHNLECLRASAVWPTIDINNCQIMKKYYCQLHFLKSRFPMQDGQAAATYFSWKDDYTKLSSSISDISFELMCVLINIGAIHTKLGAEDGRNSADGMKMSCTHFQCAAWAFQTAREVYGPLISFIMVSSEQIRGMQMVCLAQAQECILEKSLLDNRKATIIAKIAIQLSSYYRQALLAFYSGDEGLVIDHLPNHKYILQYLQFKISYHKCIALLYQGQQAEEQQKMGERVAYYNAALEALEDARKQMQKMSSSNQGPYKDTLAFTLDVVEGKRKAATNENEFIYHEDVPEIDTLQEIKGASLVKGIPFNIHDTEVSGPDIFGRLVPMEAHEASSLYSEQKAQMLREIGERIEKRDQDLNEFMSSMQLEVLSQMKNAHGLSQDLVDRAAAMVARPNVNRELVDVMGKLSNSYQEVEAMLKEVKNVLNEEEESEKEYQAIMGKRPPSIVATDLAREAAKYHEAHGKASESNQNLHKAMMTHAANIKILAQPLSHLKRQIPSLQLPDSNIDDAVIEQINNLISKVEQMKTQRMTLWNQLRDSVHQDDITGALVTKQPEQTLESVFQQELEKHKQTSALIEQNLSAQDNICKALIETYAKFTPTRKYLQDFLNKRNTTISALIASHDTYDDLLAKANKGIEFYAKLETNTSKLLQRVKGACKVQQEEREQILLKNGHVLNKSEEPDVEPVVQTKPKLKDYLDSMKDKKAPDSSVIGPQMQYPSSSLYPTGDPNVWKDNVEKQVPKNSQEYIPSPSGYTANYSSIVNSSNYGSHGYTQVNYSDKNMDQALADRMNSLKMHPTNYQYDAIASQAYNYPVNVPPTTAYSFGPTNLHTSVSPHLNSSNYSNPRSSYQTVSSTNYPYITTSEQYAPTEQKFNGTLATTGYSNYENINPVNTTPPISVNTTMSYNSKYKHDESTYYPSNYNQHPVASNLNQPNSTSYVANYNQPTISAYNQPNMPGFSPSGYKQQGTAYTQPSISTYSTTASTYSQPTLPTYSQPNSTSYDQANTSTFNQLPDPSTYNQQYYYNQSSDSQKTNQGYSYPYYNDTAYNTYNQATNSFSENATQPNLNTNTSINTATYSQYPQTHQNYNMQYYPQVNTTYSQGNTYAQTSTSYTPGNSTYTQENTSYTQGPSTYNIDNNLSHQNDTSYTQVPTYNQDMNPVIQNMPYSTTSQNPYIGASSNPVQPSGNSYPSTSSINKPNLSTIQIGYTTGTLDSNQATSSNYSQYQQTNTYQVQSQSTDSYTANQTNSSYPSADPYLNNQIGTAYTNNYYNQYTTYPNTTYNQSTTSVPDTSQSTTKKESSIDLLAGLDFSISQAPLIPQKEIKQETLESNIVEIKETPVAKKSDEKKTDPIKILKKKEKHLKKGEPFKNPDIIKQFLQEIDKFDKYVESLNVKTLSGPSTLDLKWKEIQDCQENVDGAKKSISVARCYPLKNRSPDILPYDYTRVELTTLRDDYINASHIRDVSPFSMDFIVTQTPTNLTISDFWSMVWEQQVETVVCLLSNNELKEEIYWPSEVGKELTIQTNVVTMLSSTEKEFWIERKLNYSYPELKESRIITLLQFTAWPGSLFPTNPLPFVDFMKRVISVYDQQKCNGNPVLIHCLAGVGRSGIATVLLAVLMELTATACPLPDIPGIACKISCARKNILRDREHLKFVYMSLLSYIQTLKREFTKSDNEKAEDTIPIEKAPIDPLSTLDPLWATRKS